MPETTAPPTIHHQTLPNGLTVLAEPVPGAKSLAMRLLLPGGAKHEPAKQQGVSGVLAEMMLRGAGGRSAREHSDALDRLGVQRSTDNGTHHTHLAATMVGENLPDALPLLLDTALRPNLDQTSLDPSRDLAIQSLDGLEDEPQQRAMIELRRQHHPDPLGRSGYGIREHLETMSIAQVRDFAQRAFVPHGSILSFAGAFDFEALLEQVQSLTAEWSGDAPPEPTMTDAPRGYAHHSAESSQVHIALACDALPEPDERSIVQSAAVAVLSGGMSGRLFTEVREKRGLCYAVQASYAGQRDRGTVSAYAGTTTPRAQETLDVLLAELRRLKDGVDQSEFERAIVGMKSRLVMQGESTSARAAANAADLYHVGRPRTLEELTARVDAITLDGLCAFVAEHPLDGFTLVTLGAEKLRL
jgi:predicted Zn-dependent peptidase